VRAIAIVGSSAATNRTNLADVLPKLALDPRHIWIRAALIREVKAESETTRPAQILASKSSLVTTRSRLRIRYSRSKREN
jgi:hypothetical protein